MSQAAPTDATQVKKRIAIGTAAQMISQLIMASLGVLILKIMTAHLGVHVYGTYATILAFVTTFSLLSDLGVNTITAREIAKRPEAASEIISHNLSLRLSLCAIMIPLISLIGFVFYPHTNSQLHLGILILSCYLFFDATTSILLGYFTATLRNDIAAMVNAAQQLLWLIVVIIVSVVGWRLLGFLVGYVIVSSASAGLALSLVKKRIPIRPRINVGAWRNIVGMSIALGAIQLVNMMYLKADSVMISIFRGTTAVGIYGVAYTLILAFLTLPSLIMSTLVPSMATTQRREQLEYIIQRAFHIMVIFACLLVVISYAVRRDITLTVSSRQFAAAATPFAILALATAFSYLTNVFGFASVSINKHHKILYVSLGSLFLNICLNLFFIPHFGIIGAAWATVISEVVAFIAMYSLFHKETTVSIRPAVVVKPLMIAGLLFLIASAIRPLWSSGDPFINTVVCASSLGVIYFTLLSIIRGLPSEFYEATHKILKRRG